MVGLLCLPVPLLCFFLGRCNLHLIIRVMKAAATDFLRAVFHTTSDANRV